MKGPSFLSWRPHTTVLVLIGVTIILVAIVAAYIASNFRPTVEVRLGSGVYSVWLADTDAERTKGLSGVATLAPNGGLLMDYQTEGSRGIWMKDMLVSIDIVWLDGDKKVVYIVRNASSELGTDKTFTSEKPAQYVLEIPAGSAQQSGIRIGETAVFTPGAGL